MKQFNGAGLSGPYKNEQRFKKDFIEKMAERSLPGTQYFCIETEETEPGFPDVLKISHENHAEYYEMKITDANGKFKMQESQPKFYRAHPFMNVKVLVWHSGRNRAYILSDIEIIQAVFKKCSMTLSLEDFDED